MDWILLIGLLILGGAWLAYALCRVSADSDKVMEQALKEMQEEQEKDGRTG